VRVHPEKYAGKTFQEKVAELRKELESKKKAGFVICMASNRLVTLQDWDIFEVAIQMTNPAFFFDSSSFRSSATFSWPLKRMVHPS
jgi:AAA+ ATPase superfamily predicted ATPase